MTESRPNWSLANYRRAQERPQITSPCCQAGLTITSLFIPQTDRTNVRCEKCGQTVAHYSWVHESRAKEDDPKFITVTFSMRLEGEV